MIKKILNNIEKKYIHVYIMDYKTKYLKYKTKYLNLSKKIQTGGRWNSIPTNFVPYGIFYINSENRNKILVLKQQYKPTTYLTHFTEDYKYITKYNNTVDINGLYNSIPRPVMFDIGSGGMESFKYIFDFIQIDDVIEYQKKLIEQLFDGYEYIYDKLTENGETMVPIYNDNILLCDETIDMYIKIIPYNFEDRIFRVPENIYGMNNIINEKTCVFNLGTLFYFILSENENNNEKLYQDIYNNRDQYKNIIVDAELEPLKDLTFRMLSRDPNDRPTFDMIRDIIHPTPFEPILHFVD
jgi:hypothetical protein